MVLIKILEETDKAFPTLTHDNNILLKYITHDIYFKVYKSIEHKLLFIEHLTILIESYE